jgi:hypothetical protein
MVSNRDRRQTQCQAIGEAGVLGIEQNPVPQPASTITQMPLSPSAVSIAARASRPRPPSTRSACRSGEARGITVQHPDVPGGDDGRSCALTSARLRRLVAKLVPIRMRPATGMARRFLGVTGHQNQALEKTAAPAPWKLLCDSHFFHRLDGGDLGRIFNLCEPSRPPLGAAMLSFAAPRSWLHAHRGTLGRGVSSHRV